MGLYEKTKIQRETNDLKTGLTPDLFKAFLGEIPSSQKVSLKKICKKLNIKNKLGLALSKTAVEQGYVTLKKHFLQSPSIRARKKLVKERAYTDGWLNTPADLLYEIVTNKVNVSIDDVSKTLEVNQKSVEYLASLMKPFIEIEYPLNIFSNPTLTLGKTVDELENHDFEGDLIEEYDLVSDFIKAHVRIVRGRNASMPLYEVKYPTPGVGTRILLDNLAEILPKKIEVEADEVNDPKKTAQLKEKFISESLKLVRGTINLPLDLAKTLSGILFHNTFGLGEMELLMSDDWLEEVCVNTSNIPFTVYHRRHGWCKTNLSLKNEKDVYNYASQIGRKIGKDITTLDPIMDAHLLSGDRVNASLFPISSFGNTITIRKFARRPWTIIDFISPEFEVMTSEIAAFLWMSIQYELNIIVGGGTAAGKTSVLNALASLIQPTHRIVSIEDTREISLPDFLNWNWIALTTKEENPEGQGKITMLDLIVASLRMRPDRIIVGEIRRKREAEVLFEAMHTGHSVYSTIHADTGKNLKRRLLEPPIEIPPTEVEAVHLMIIQYRDRTTGKRKLREVVEVIPGSDNREFNLNYLYRFNPRQQTFSRVNESKRVLEDLALHTGLNREELGEELIQKRVILEWMLEKKIRDINHVGQVLDQYYRDPGKIYQLARNKGDFNRT